METGNRKAEEVADLEELGIVGGDTSLHRSGNVEKDAGARLRTLDEKRTGVFQQKSELLDMGFGNEGMPTVDPGAIFLDSSLPKSTKDSPEEIMSVLVDKHSSAKKELEELKKDREELKLVLQDSKEQLETSERESKAMKDEMETVHRYVTTLKTFNELNDRIKRNESAATEEEKREIRLSVLREQVSVLKEKNYKSRVRVGALIAETKGYSDAVEVQNENITRLKEDFTSELSRITAALAPKEQLEKDKAMFMNRLSMLSHGKAVVDMVGLQKDKDD